MHRVESTLIRVLRNHKVRPRLSIFFREEFNQINDSERKTLVTMVVEGGNAHLEAGQENTISLHSFGRCCALAIRLEVERIVADKFNARQIHRGEVQGSACSLCGWRMNPAEFSNPGLTFDGSFERYGKDCVDFVDSGTKGMLADFSPVITFWVEQCCV